MGKSKTTYSSGIKDMHNLARTLNETSLSSFEKLNLIVSKQSSALDIVRFFFVTIHKVVKWRVDLYIFYLCAGFGHCCFRGWCNARTNSDSVINITSYVYSNRVILCHKMLLLWFPSSKVSFKLPFNSILILLKTWNMLIIWVTNDIYFMYFNWYTVTLWHFKITFFTTPLGIIRKYFFVGIYTKNS